MPKRGSSNDAVPKPAFRLPVVFPHPGGYQVPRNEYDQHLLDVIRMQLDLAEHSPLPQIRLTGRMQRFQLDHGRFFTPQPLPRQFKPGLKRACFKNAQELAANCNELTYVEGLAFCMIDAPHAWCVDAEGNVVDTTWTDAKQIASAYFGVPLSRDYVIESFLARGVHDALVVPAAFLDSK